MRLRLTLLLAAALAMAIALPGPAAAVVLLEAPGASDGTPIGTPAGAPNGGTVQPTPAPDATDNGATAQATYAYSMYRARTHVVQKTNWFCVGASTLMMFNLINGTSYKGYNKQEMYWRYAQDHSTYPVLDNGADAGGWAAAMRHWGAGNYTVGVHNTMQAALRAAAKRMRATGKPVGLIVWGSNKGHAWVMTGFKSTGDPKFTDDYTVTTVQAMGPLWPYGTINGQAYDPGPKEWVGYTELRRKFTQFHQRSAPAWDGRWLTVLP
jgi:hypothetical protein